MHHQEGVSLVPEAKTEQPNQFARMWASFPPKVRNGTQANFELKGGKPPLLSKFLG